MERVLERPTWAGRSVQGIFFAISMASALISCRSASAEDAPDFREDYQRGPQCGLNVVHAILRLQNLAVDRRDLKVNGTLPAEGMSVAEVCGELTRWGVPSVAVRVNPSELANDVLPAIAHIGHEATGHYIVLLNVEREKATGELKKINYLDGTTYAVRQ